MAERLPGIVLAAGHGSRFFRGTGQNKLLLLVEGRPVIYRSVGAMLSAKLVEPVLLVVGFEHERVLSALGKLQEHPKLQIVVNEQWAEGLSTSLRAALAHLSERAPGVLVLPGDMPFMTPQLVDRVARRFLETGKICFPTYRGQKGHPTAIPRALFPELQRLTGDAGALRVVEAHRDETEHLELSAEEALTQVDIDRAEDLRRAIERSRGTDPDHFTD